MRRPGRRWGILLLLIVLVLIGLFLWQKWIEELAKQSISRTVISEQIKADSTPLPQVGLFSGRYFQLKTPPGARIIDGTKVGIDPKALEYYSFDMTSPRLVISMTVYDAAQIEVTQLADFPSVRYRQITTELYSSDTQVLAGYPAMIFFKLKDGSETTAFWLVKGKFYSLAVSSAYQVPEVDLVFSQLIEALTLSP